LAREGQRGNSLSQDAQNIFNKKIAPNFFIFFSAQKFAGRLTAIIHGSGVPPPLRGVYPPRQILDYAYAVTYIVIGVYLPEMLGV